MYTIQYRPFKGYTLRSVRGRGAKPNDVLSSWPLPEYSVKKVQLGQGASSSTAKHLAAIECTVLGKLHALVAFACTTKYDDDSPRQPGWWTVQTRGAAWQVVLKDPDSGCKLVATGNSLDDALALAVLLLESEEAPWEPDPYLKGVNGRKKKNA